MIRRTILKGMLGMFSMAALPRMDPPDPEEVAFYELWIPENESDNPINAGGQEILESGMYEIQQKVTWHTHSDNLLRFPDA